MKLKKLLFATSVALLSLSASAANPEDVRIYINPGHGSFTSDDRPQSTIKHGSRIPIGADTANFYESNTNLDKGFGLLEKLVEYGVKFDRSKGALDMTNNVVMSRVKNGGANPGVYNKALSTIATEAQTNNFDMFVSIHSNATTGDHDVPTHLNHCLFLYRGYDGSPSVSGSDKMAMACWPHAISNKHMNWNWLADPTRPRDNNYSSDANYVRYFPKQNYYPSGNDAEGNPYWIKGDLDFMYYDGSEHYGTTTINNVTYKGYYAVLRHAVPGFLVEGYDHTYQPGLHRAMNEDVCRHEGEMYARGINDYFGWGKTDSYGKIYGIVRDHSVVMDHAYYQVTSAYRTGGMGSTNDANQTINQIDNKKPLNNVIVTLYNSNGVAVDTYTTDDEWNGAYFFKKVAPGTYTIKHSLNGYKEVTQTVTVTANETNYLNIDMREASAGDPIQGHYAYGLKLTKVDDETYTASFKSTGAMSNGKIILTNTSTKAQTVIQTGAISKGSNNVTIDATELEDGANYSWAVALDNPQSTGVDLIHSDNSVVSSGACLGLAIDNDETSANFGNIYTNTGSGQGIQRFNPDLSKNGSKVLSGYFGKNGYSNRLTVYGGKVYVANNNSTNPGVWVYNPSATTATTTNILSAEVNGVAFYGEGANRKMYTINGGDRLAYGYNIGASDTKQSTASTTFSNIQAKLWNDGDIIATDKGLFVSQRRFRVGNNASSPAFMVASYSDVINYTSEGLSSTLPGTERGGMALSKDQKTFAIVDGWEQTSSFVGIEGDIELEIYNVTWSGNTPSFTHSYTIPLSGTHRVDQLAFDHANNLYIASREQGLLVYAIKNPSRQTVTNGSGTITGVNPPTPLYIVGNSDAVGNWDPANAVEFTNNGTNYTITLDENTTEFKISTGKGDISGDWTEFDAGNLTTNEAITNGGTINLIAQHSYNNFVLPWAGVWNITVSGDLSTLTATTTTPKPLPPLYIVGNTAELGAWNTENAVEVANDGTKYTVTLNENVTAFKISTNKGDATTFNNGNLTPGGAITNGGTLNLIADKDGGNIALPWEGVWNVTIAGDLSTLHASTSTPNPDEGPGIGAEPEDAPNPDAEPTETDEAEDAQTEGYFAYDLQSSKSGDVYTFKFKSTGARKNGRIVLTNKSTGAKTEIKTPVVKGQNTITINAYDIVKGDYTWAVKLTNNANSTVTQVASDNSIVLGNGRIGVAIDNDQTSKNFGAIYTITGTGKGLQKFNADMTKNGSLILTGKFGQQTGYTTRSNRLEVNQGKVYIANYASENPGVWVYDPTGTETVTKVSGSTYYERAIAFYGEGANRIAFGSHNSTRYVQRFNIGTNSSWVSGSPSAYFYQAGVLDNGDGDILVTNNAVIVSQNRYTGNNQATNPVFAVFDHNLNLILKSNVINSTLTGSSNGGMAITPDYKTFAIINGRTETAPASGVFLDEDLKVYVYSVSWNGSTPTFTHQYNFALSGTRQVDQMEFDHAGNLYIASREKGLLKWAVKTSDRATVTNSTATITGLGNPVPSNVVATRKCYGEGSNTTAGTVDADITWTGEAGEYKVYYQTMRRDASGNRVYDNNGTWVEAGTATIASGSTSGKFTHKNLAPGSDYNRIYNYKVANYYSAANYASEVKSKSISGKGRTVTSAAPVVPVNVVLSQPSTVVDGVTQYSLDLKLDLSLNSSVFNSTLLDDNDELVTATKYVIVVDEATAKALNAASNVKEVGRFYQGPATMTANNCNHFTIADWYMVVDFDDVTPTGDLSVATKSLTWEDVDLTMTYKPQVYTSAVRTFNFNANSAESAAYTISFPTPQWTATNTTEDASGNVTNNVEIIPVASDQISSIVGTEDMPIGSFRKVGDTENATNSVAITQANVIGVTGAIEPLPASDDVLNEWDITYTFQVQDAQGNVVYTSQQESKNNTTNANLYSNTKK
ncbi:MAG: carboxypeptidase regulatory-like domain-containing protein, partial [Muribaculaceae bacterium]|nr:carboxypeptidase regulatory-like domain-containing protein [Muribaculaceae bacterium]